MATDSSATASASDRSPTPDTPSSSSHLKTDDRSKKRSIDDSNSSSANQKVTKRRAARACVSCRSRKVRCDVVEGAPCGNCRWDNVECVVQESRRRKKHLHAANPAGQGSSAEAQLLCKVLPNTNNTAATNAASIGPTSASLRRPSHCSAISTSSVEMATGLLPDVGSDMHVPHRIYQNAGYHRHDSVPLAATSANTQPSSSELPQPPQWTDLLNQNPLFGDSRTAQFLNSLDDSETQVQLPLFVRPLPARIEPEDVRYLHVKGALTLPGIDLQNALLQSYAEYVHPYMPLLDLHEFLAIVNCRDGLNGQASLFLYQAIMFAATAFVDMQYLRDAGYTSRKAARRSFFQKTRLLYDFDYESDRLILVQALLLMTYWYETPDDQKDTWHWMGVAISLAHTIGLHRNPETTSIAPSKQKLWKRIWWSCFMRDRLIALGMRRPTRIKDEDFDVPMLTEQDFDIQALPENNTVISHACTLMRDLSMQRELAIMCIYKAKLCVCISHMLRTQYSVLIRDKVKPDNTTTSTMMLFPNKKLDNVESVSAVDMELMTWAESLPKCCQYRALTPNDTKDGRSSLAVQRTLLHMVYYTTVSALHRPQFLPSSPLHAPTTSRQAQDMSRMRVRDAAMHITHMAAQLHQHRLEGFLPTTGVTVILPAMIIHLLEMKNPSIEARQRAMYGFRQCMRVMEKLREVYAAADYATGFLDAALRKAAISVDAPSKAQQQQQPSAFMMENPAPSNVHTPPPENAPYMTAAETVFNKRPQARQMMLPPNTINAAALELTTTTPPQTEFDPIASVITPSASGGSEEAQVDVDAMDMDMDLNEDYDEFDWNALAGTDVDVDQWLQFPPDNGNTVDTIGAL
ncbi:cutinase transcription factor 1 [Stachybotrys elegans]|uniref:Cutinase transcription factor 1 n=1 Tax=Stachybotrys elegans TaxID=80388 RepID=A0A8K0WQX5_9HYPO|nr:cutinase transcription factor 1 [Stachybotrys elegans]